MKLFESQTQQENDIDKRRIFQYWTVLYIMCHPYHRCVAGVFNWAVLRREVSRRGATVPDRYRLQGCQVIYVCTMMMTMMKMMDCRYQEFRPFTVSGHDRLSISQGTLYAQGRFQLIIKWNIWCFCNWAWAFSRLSIVHPERQSPRKN